MPVTPPTIEDRGYQDFLDEALARIPAHTPDWTNWSDADPGIVLLQLFAFMAESVAYRTTFVPERTRRSFLSLLGRPLSPGAPARGLVRFDGPTASPLAPKGVPAGTVLSSTPGFSLDGGVRVLPLEARVFVKTALDDDSVSAETMAWYNAYYRARGLEVGSDRVQLYRADEGDRDLDLSKSVDGYIHIALLAPSADAVGSVRAAIAGDVLCLGVVPSPSGAGAVARVDGGPVGGTTPALELSCPSSGRGRWRLLSAAAGDLSSPCVVQIELPAKDDPGLSPPSAWTDLEPTDAGTGDLPPETGDDLLEERLVTWLRVRSTTSAALKIRWIGMNAGLVTQGRQIHREPLGTGAGEPDQRYLLAQPPVVPSSLRVEVREPSGAVSVWSQTEDLYLAPREGDAGCRAFQLDPATGELRFGDGLRGARPRGAVLVTYVHSDGVAGNLGAGALKGEVHSLPYSNPVPTWGGASAETLAQAERSVSSWLQHRDRLVTVADFETLAWETPSATLARVDVLPAFAPGLDATDPGDVPGAVTVLVLAPYPADMRAAPPPDDPLVEAVCAWLAPRRLITTELYVRGPTWVPIAVSVGVEAANGDRASAVTAARAAVLAFLSAQPVTEGGTGWRLGRAVKASEIAAAVARAEGVSGVRGVRLVRADTRAEVTEIALRGLELPWVVSVDAVEGEAPPLGVTPTTAAPSLPVPIIPDECR